MIKLHNTGRRQDCFQGESMGFFGFKGGRNLSLGPLNGQNKKNWQTREVTGSSDPLPTPLYMILDINLRALCTLILSGSGYAC